ncbi:hypothetical protein TK90_2705 (plasmid) [Thioalkalivibrio sp. K90mix]|uniref:hypothetical protein n=1 Tax=Thioalkalivibrio sp. (strain K90mix) TaxID=396595 RepID=UPI000195A4C7|nr:hypothetical protein [Thioalkalivibrio sp. K90mix]ADC73191.1 hypothetical protein TK90_2705 [Thioalkalivibrio sp. K90mix]
MGGLEEAVTGPDEAFIYHFPELYGFPKSTLTQLGSGTGRIVHPRERFDVAPEDAIRVAEAIVDGTIAKYRLGPISGRVLTR